MSTLAGMVGQGRSQLFRRIKQVTGTTPTELIKRVRLEHAAGMLEAGAGSVSEVAYGVGFKSVAHFCNRFRDTYGSTPASYAAMPSDSA